MKNKRNLVVDAETVIVNLMREDQRTYLSIPRLHRLIDYIYEQLVEQNFLSDERVIFDVSFDAIERTVMYNNNLFDLVGDTIYLKTSIDKIEIKCEVDERLSGMIKAFCAAA